MLKKSRFVASLNSFVLQLVLFCCVSLFYAVAAAAAVASDEDAAASFSFAAAAAAARAGDAVSTSTPDEVMSNVCSHCAERLPSRVTTVHPSAHISDLGDLFKLLLFFCYFGEEKARKEERKRVSFLFSSLRHGVFFLDLEKVKTLSVSLFHPVPHPKHSIGSIVKVIPSFITPGSLFLQCKITGFE